MVGGRFFACLLAFVILSSVTATSTVDQYEVGSRVRMEAKINSFINQFGELTNFLPNTGFNKLNHPLKTM